MSIPSSSEASSPEIYSITPNIGSTTSSTEITIQGAGFTPDSAISFYREEASIVGSYDYWSYDYWWMGGYIEGDLYVSGAYAYVAIDSGIQVIDISDPYNPHKVGACNTSGAHGVSVKGNYAYVAGGNSGLQVIDISDPNSPFLVGSCDTPDFACGVSVSGNYAYVADDNSGLQLIDISDPNSPFLVGSCDTPDSARNVYLAGSYAYVADWSSGLQVIDISDPNNPAIAGSCDTQGHARGVSVSGTYAYVAGFPTLQVINVSDPNSPSLVGSFDAPIFANNAYVNDSYAYVPGMVEDFFGVIDISDPDTPFLEALYFGLGSSFDVWVDGPYAYVAAERGLLVLSLVNTPLVDITYNNPNSITATVPAGYSPGEYNLIIINPDGSRGGERNAFTIVSPGASGMSVPVELSIGLNLLGYPVRLPQGYTSFNLINDLGTKDEVSKLQRYDPNTENYETVSYDENGIPCGKEFPIVSGEGYLVYMKSDKSISFTGSIVSPGISCRKGFNILSFPGLLSDHTSYDLLSYLGSPDEISSIQRLNRKSGMLETTQYYGREPSGVKFPIAQDEAYLVHMKTDQYRDPPFDLVTGNTAFAVDFYHAIESRQGNLFFSPYSLSLALAMTYAGAGGETAQQMKETLHLPFSQDTLPPIFRTLNAELAESSENTQGEELLNITNSMWGQEGYPFLSSFLDLIAENYGSGLEQTDFANAPEASRININDWIFNQTMGRISDLIPSGEITPEVVFVLVNAVYFKAAWKHTFPPESTSNSPFYLLEGGQATVPMMYQQGYFAYTQGENYQAVELLYEGEDFSMVVILPHSGKFAEVESSLDLTQLRSIISKLQKGLSELKLKMPRFTYCSDSLSLKNILSQMGMPNAFNCADFSGIDGTHNLFLFDCFHKAFIRVNEEGTEAAASSGVIGGWSYVPSFTVNRPFIFFIRHINTGTILFIGRIMNPLG